MTNYNNLSAVVELARCTVCGPVTGNCSHFGDQVTYIELCVAGKGYSDPGRTWGPPEDCYPPEGEMEPTRCQFGDWVCEGMPEGLTEGEEDAIIQALWDATEDCDCDDDYPAEPDYDDDVDEAQEWHDFDPDC